MLLIFFKLFEFELDLELVKILYYESSLQPCFTKRDLKFTNMSLSLVKFN